MGRPRSRVLVEEAEWITARDVARLAVFAPLRSALVERHQPFLGGPAVVCVRFLRCPRCGARRRALYSSTSGLACRVCLGLTYRSKSERWDFPLIDHMAVRRDALARQPGPKGRKYRAEARRVERVESVAKVWLDAWERRYGDLFQPR